MVWEGRWGWDESGFGMKVVWEEGECGLDESGFG